MPKHTINEEFPNELFVTLQKGGEDTYYCTYENPVDAVDAVDAKRVVVATYKLVKTEDLRLERSTRVVKVKKS